MKRIMAAGAAALVVLTATTACSSARRSQIRQDIADRRSDQTVSLTVGGLQRSYILHKPITANSASTTGSAKLPAVLVFHGGGGSAGEIESGTDFDAAADKAGFLAVYPAGLDHSWNDLRTGDTKSNLAGVDDIGFVSALIDQLVAQDHADPAHIYATGMSNGGMFTETLGCKLADKLAAIAPVSGTLPSEVAPVCAPAKPIPVLEIHGTADPIVPFDGGHVALTSGSGGMRPGPATILSVAETQKVWREKDHCTAAPTTKKLPDTAADGTAVSIDTTAGCANGTSVSLYTVTNGGHTWPGGSQYLPAAVVGRVTRQISGTDVIIDFFTADVHRT